MNHAMHRPLKQLLLALAFAVALPAAAAPTADQINLDMGTPPIMVVRHSLTQRSSRLVWFYEHGVIGLDFGGMVKMRDASHLNLALRQIAEKLIDQENPEREALILAVAEAHGGKEAMPAAREAQVKRWKEHFHSGWWMQDAQGNWFQKP